MEIKPANRAINNLIQLDPAQIVYLAMIERARFPASIERTQESAQRRIVQLTNQRWAALQEAELALGRENRMAARLQRESNIKWVLIAVCIALATSLFWR